MVLASREGVTPKGFRPADAVMWRLDRSAAYTAAAPVVSVTVAVTSTLPVHASARETSQRGLSHLPEGRGGGREEAG